MKRFYVAEALDQVTPLILTFNEEANIARNLAGLGWAKRIVVVDSGSTDHTLEILTAHLRVEVVQRPFDSFAQQSNFGLGLIHTSWCLSLDADHICTVAFQAELASLLEYAVTDLAAVRTPFRYLIHGRPVRCGIYPPRFNLVRPSRGHFENDGHSHRFVPAGPTASMRQPLLHDDRKPLSRWLASQQTYLSQETHKLLHTPISKLGLNDRLRLLHGLTPLIVPLYCLIWHRGLLDGWRGWFYAFQRAYAEILLSLMLWEARHGQ